jgi:YVTN family beta-propeller protein
LASIKTTSKGVASRTSNLTAAQVSLVKRATAGTGKIAIRVGSAATGGVKCGLFTALAVPPVAKVTAKITVGSVPSDIAVGAGGVWVTDLVGNALFRIDPATNQVAGPLALGAPSAAMAMAVAASGDAVWVASNTLPLPGDGMVLRVDPTSRSVVATIPVGSGALDIAAGAGAVWVISARDGTVSRIDPATNSVTATVHVGVNPGGIGVGAGAVWVADYLGAALVRLDQTTGQVVATVKLAGPARKVAVSPDAVWVIVAEAWGAIGTLVRVNPKTNAIVASIPLKADPWGVASTASAVWVAAKAISDAIWVNPATNTIGGRVPLGGDSIGVDVGGSTAWLVGQTAAEVVRIDFSGVTQGPPAATPPATATPSPTPSPPAGGSLFVGPYLRLAIPAGWSPVRSDDPDISMFAGPGFQLLGAMSVGTSLTLEETSAQIIAGIKSQSDIDPEQTEPITMDGVPGRMLTYHFPNMGMNVHGLFAFCTHNGRAYEIVFRNAAGAETADRALFLDVLTSFIFGPGF